MGRIIRVIFLEFAGGCGSGNFKTSQAFTECAQATQQFFLGQNAYVGGNFAAAKTDFQNAVNDWNNAISTESYTGGGLQLSSTLGSLLLGLGAVIGAVAALIYATRRAKVMSVASATH